MKVEQASTCVKKKLKIKHWILSLLLTKSNLFYSKKFTVGGSSKSKYKKETL